MSIKKQPKEQRQEYRINQELTVYLELESSTENTPASIVVSRSVDISANGFRVITDRELTPGNIMRTCVQTKQGIRFILITEVKWLRQWKDTSDFLAGLALFESEDSNIQEWKEFVAAQMA